MRVQRLLAKCDKLLSMCLARPNVAKRMECVQLAAAFASPDCSENLRTVRKRQQAARTPYASRHSDALNTYSEFATGGVDTANRLALCWFALGPSALRLQGSLNP